MTVRLGRVECVGEVGRSRDRSEDALDEEDRGIVVAATETGAHRLGGAVLEDHAVVVKEEGVADGGLDADVWCIWVRGAR